MAQGRKTGGRAKGTPNRATAAKAVAIAESGDTPLDYMLAVMRNEDLPFDARLKAAWKAAPYVHPKLGNVTVQGDDDQPVRHVFEWAKSSDAS